MESFGRLDELSKEVAFRDYLKAKRKHIAEELAQMAQEEIRLQSQLKKETYDYKRIEKLSEKQLVTLFSEHYESMRDQEYREMKIAEYKYNSLIEKMALAGAEIKSITDHLANNVSVEQEYETLLNIKRAWALSLGVSQIDSLESELRFFQGKQKELDEAIVACKKLITSLTNAREDLIPAMNWGVFDKLGGGLIPVSVKEDCINRASQYIKDSSHKAMLLGRELLDLRHYFNLSDIQVSSLSKAFETFFVNVLNDLTIQEEIDRAYETISENHERAEAILHELVKLRDETQIKIDEIIQKRNEVLLSL
ncbi:MAG: hypothetical protein BGO41_05425 [Clostridiales bacterium 38-18]|nr:MAG: hypothetical protein BGO41_05425 [Clostridiales bacterium 38-18]